MGDQRLYDVVVVGAGAAGLTAAYRLLQAQPSLSLVVLEARDRVGGRTLTLDVDVGGGSTDKFDLGGQWVASSQKHVLNMMQELGLSAYPQYLTGKKVMQLGDNKVRTYTSDIPSLGSFWALIELQLFIWRAERVAARTPITDPYSSPHAAELEGETVDSYMRKYMTCKAALEAIDVGCKAAFGTDASRISVMFFLAYANAAGGVMKVFEGKKDAAQEARVKGGTQQISELLAEKIGCKNVQLTQVVQEVRQTEEAVEVVTEGGHTFRAKRAILTLPPNLLAKLRFNPPLPPYKQLVYENLPVGHLTKFIITYKSAFWREKGYSGEVVSNGGQSSVPGVSRGPLSACFDATTDRGTPAIVGFIAGRQGVEWNNKTESERQEGVLTGLAELLGPEASDCISYTEKVWAEEKYSGGCPVVFGTPGIMYAFPHLRLPFDKVHFAGTETATEWTGFISGAIQSGERAAKEVLYNLFPKFATEDSLRGTCYDKDSLPKDFKTIKHTSPSPLIKYLLYVAVVVGLLAFLVSKCS